ncbi:AbrB/MazE/SpoVT family DNA-binding domain-containing protein [Candidatus Daviesbacteria bacterium]|nr:AbrB/MazE/SpoVT family DNA-binding domain-containing protein [Candidatus Daviesbacteria bacterium]
MFYHSSLTQKGQATIPVPIRQFLGLKPGQVVTFEKRGEDILLQNQQKLIEELYGSLKPKVKVKYSDKKADEAIGKMLAEEYLKTLPKKYWPHIK